MPGTPILVVDDAPVNRKLIRLLLTHEGYDVRTAERAEDALEMLSNYHPELILADIQLPGMNGLDMTRKVKQDPRTRSIRVVALTACAMKEDRENALRAGCEDYISKPIDTATLASRLRELLARPPLKYVAPAETQEIEAPLGFSGTEFESLRRRFLNEGADRSRQLLDSLSTGIDEVRAARQFHEWTGSAALLGHPEISTLARNAEEIVREEPVKTAPLHELLTDLYLTFVELRESTAPAPPDYIVQAAAGKNVALIGFSLDRADLMCALLERVKARPRIFEASDDPDSDAVRDCDLVVVHVRPDTLGSSWLRPGPAVRGVKKLVFLGEQRDLMALAPDVRSRALDFLVAGEEPEEILLRLAFTISRTGSAVGETRRVGTAQPTETPGKLSIARPNIFLADDDGIVLALVKSTLMNYGMVCRTADNGLDALALIRSERPHAAVLDVNMPGMDGFEVLAAIREENLGCKVILLTALQHEQEILRAFKLGADDYLTKPFNPFELVARLKRLLQ
jgi:two-component system, cell cycle response regulator DivK